MYKKTVASLFAVVIGAIFLTACLSSTPPPAPSSTPASGAASAPAPGSAPSSQAKVIKISNSIGEKHPTVVTEKEIFKKMVEEKTNGKFVVEVYHSSQLSDDLRAIEAARAGSHEAISVASAAVMGFLPEIAIFDIPFLFASAEVADTILDGPIGKKISDMFPAKGLYNLGWAENGYRHLTNSVRAVKTPADLKGLKIRTMENPIHLASFKAMGANPTPMPWSEAFTALQQGAIDGQENPIPNFYSNRVHEVNKYISLTGHVYSPMLFLISKKIMDSYPEDVQAIIKEAALETCKAQRKLNREYEIKNLQEIKDYGCVVTELTPEQKKPFQEATLEVWKMVEEKVDKGLMSELKAELAKLQ